MLLKHIPGMLPVLENSDLSLTKLWHKKINNIVPEQFTAIILKTTYANPESKIALEVQFAVKQIRDAVDQGLIPETRLAHFNAPEKQTMSLYSFVRGLHSLSFAQRRAVLFGLEAKIPLSQVEQLTRGQTYRMKPNVPKVAREIIETNVISIHEGWAFWEADQGKHQPLTNLEQHVYTAFGMTSYQLARRYANLDFNQLELHAAV